MAHKAKKIRRYFLNGLFWSIFVAAIGIFYLYCYQYMPDKATQPILECFMRIGIAGSLACIVGYDYFTKKQKA